MVARRFGGLEHLFHVFDGVVLHDTGADCSPIGALLAEHVVLWVDEHHCRVGPVDIQVGEELVANPRMSRTASAAPRSPATTENRANVSVCLPISENIAALVSRVMSLVTVNVP